MSLQHRVIPEQNVHLAPILVALFGVPEGCAKVCEIIATYFHTWRLPIQQIRCPIGAILGAEEIRVVMRERETGSGAETRLLKVLPVRG